MKKQLLYLLPLFALCIGAVSIKWFNDYPAGRPLATNDIVAIQRTGPNRYVYGDLNDVKNAIVAGSQVWTNDRGFVYPFGSSQLDTNGISTNSPRFFLRSDQGSLFEGTHVSYDTDPWGPTRRVLYSFSLVQSNEPSLQKFAVYTTDNLDYTSQGYLFFTTETNKVILEASTYTDANFGRGFGIEADITLSPTNAVAYIKDNGIKNITFHGDGRIGCNGFYSLSNSTPNIPSAARLGAGGYWTGNSNGFLVTVYSLDGLATIMKVLAP